MAGTLRPRSMLGVGPPGVPLALRSGRARQVCEQLRRLTTDLEAATQPCLKVSTAGKVRRRAHPADAAGRTAARVL